MWPPPCGEGRAAATEHGDACCAWRGPWLVPPSCRCSPLAADLPTPCSSSLLPPHLLRSHSLWLNVAVSMSQVPPLPLTGVIGATFPVATLGKDEWANPTAARVIQVSRAAG